MTNRSTGNPAVAPAGCPITHTDYRVERPIFGHYAQLNAEREQSDFLKNDKRLHELEDKMNQLLKELKDLKEDKSPKESN